MSEKKVCPECNGKVVEYYSRQLLTSTRNMGGFGDDVVSTVCLNCGLIRNYMYGKMMKDLKKHYTENS